MTLINLLPHRAAAKKRHQGRFNRQLGYSVFVGFALAFACYLLLQEKIKTQQQGNQTLVSQSGQLEQRIKGMAALQNELQALLVRQHAVDDLQAARNIPVYLMTELARQVPEGVYLTSLRMDKSRVTVQGVSPSSEKVADFLHHLGADSVVFTQPELLEVVGASANLAAFAPRKVSSFSLHLPFKHLQSADTPRLVAPEKTGPSSP